MGTLVVEKEINAPVETVFQQMSDIENCVDTMSGITRIEMLSQGPVGVGTRWKETRVMFGKEAVEEMAITEFQPNRFYVVEAESCGSHFRTDIRFSETGSGTRVQMETTSKPLTLAARLMLPLGFLMKTAMRKCLEKDLADAKRRIEGGIASASATNASPTG